MHYFRKCQTIVLSLTILINMFFFQFWGYLPLSFLDELHDMIFTAYSLKANQI